jgi:hypothetical protein
MPSLVIRRMRTRAVTARERPCSEEENGDRAQKGEGSAHPRFERVLIGQD